MPPRTRSVKQNLGIFGVLVTHGLDLGLLGLSGGAGFAVDARGGDPDVLGVAGRWRDRMHNLAMAAINSAATSTVFAALTYLCVEWAHVAGFGALRWVAAPRWMVWVVGLMAIDLAYYAFHVLAHRWAWLWRFHVVHHHDTAVTDECRAVPRGGDRDAVRGDGRGVHGAGGGDGAGVGLSADPDPVAMFHHANIVISERGIVLRLVVVTPRMHWVHHSRWQPERRTPTTGACRGGIGCSGRSACVATLARSSSGSMGSTRGTAGRWRG